MRKAKIHKNRGRTTAVNKPARKNCPKEERLDLGHVINLNKMVSFPIGRGSDVLDSLD